MAKKLEFDSELKLMSELAKTPYEKGMVRVSYMLLGYVRVLELEVDMLARGVTDKTKTIFQK